MLKPVLGVVVAGLILGGCANMYTIDRDTPYGDQSGDKDKSGGKVVHLDVQQRLFIANNMGKFCTEPSPDALASFAAAAGLSASSPAKGAVEAAISAGSNAASIGLRTQSITLMRDTLYRMCEAYANGNLSNAQVMSLLGRSQDLTAVILATEQLTGAVVANQALLTTRTEAEASAIMASNQKILNQIREDKENAIKRVDQSTRELGEAQEKEKTAKADLATARALPAGAERDAQVAQKQQALSNAELQVKTAEEILASREKNRDDIIQLESDVAKNQEAARVSSSISASGTGAFASSTQVKALDNNASVQVAKSVEAMVTAVLSKSYASDYCLAILEQSQSIGEREEDVIQASDEVIATCNRLVLKVAEAEIDRFAALTDGSDGIDRTPPCLRNWMRADPANVTTIKEWLKTNGGAITVSELLNSPPLEPLRKAAITSLGATCE